MEKFRLTDKKKTINKITCLNNQEKVYKKNIEKIRNEKEEIYKGIIVGFKVTEINDLCLQLREKFLQNEEIKTIIEKYRLSINDIALIENHSEQFDWPPPWSVGWSTEEFSKAFESNCLQVRRHYLYGGPEDNLKIIFRDCNNGHHVLTGFQFKFPEKPKRDWKATFKGRTA
jgi:hypothetical protein